MSDHVNALRAKSSASNTGRLTVKGDAPVATRPAKPLSPGLYLPTLPVTTRQPPDSPQLVVRLRMRRHARLPLDAPDARLAVHGAREQILARFGEVKGQDPGGIGCCGAGGAEGEVADVLAVLHVVEGNDACVAGCGEKGTVRGERDGADGLCET